MGKADLSNVKVLIVEDNPTFQYIVQEQLKKVALDSVTVSNGVEAIEALKSKEFTIVLMDINMPEQDGLDAARWIRDIEDPYFKEVPIFALTSFGEQEHTREILEAGMNVHMVKPFDLDLFLYHLDKLQKE
jgi:CheY-like chemotaxis protein